MIERAVLTVRIGVAYQNEESGVLEKELSKFFDEYFGDEMWVESFVIETTTGDKDVG